MFFDKRGMRVFVYREPIDMRAGFEKLLSFCVHHLGAEMNQGHVYIFFGKNRRRLKLLIYDRSGLVLIAKRMERGGFMSHAELLGRAEISLQELKLIVHGSVLRGPLIDRSFVPQKSESQKSVTQRESFALPVGMAPSL